MKLSKQTEKEVLQVYDTWLHSYMHGDVATYDSYFDDDYHFIGSTDNEEFLSRKDTTKFFENTAEQLAGKCDLRKETRILEQFGELVFITHVFDAWFLNGTEYSYYGRFRFTNILHETRDGWRFIYQHFSMPDSKTEEGETIGFDKVHAENQELREAIKRRTVELERKNRELEIEAAVERVRAEAMAMHSTEDFGKVSRQLLQQVKNLGLKGFFGATIYLIDENEFFNCYDFSSFGNMTDAKNQFFRYDAKKYPMLGRYPLHQWKKGERYFELDFDFEKLQEAVKEMEEVDFDAANSLKEALSGGHLTHQWDACGRLSNGFIAFDLINPPDDDVRNITVKMTHAFEQAYIRFLDLQKAEAQAREAQIEAALERVRAQTMAMHNSEDVGECIVKMFSEVTALGVPESTRFGIGILNHDNENNQLWTASKDGEEVKMHIGNIEMTWHPLLISARKAWKAQVPLHEYVLEGEDLLNYYQMLNDAPDYPLRIAMENLPERQFHYGFVFEHGFFYAFSPREFQPDLIRIVHRFTSLFGQTYRRYLDLVTAEAQVREAKIEIALERIRSQATSMQQSTDLLDVVVTMRNEFIRLGHEAHYFWHMLWTPEKYEKAMTSGDGTRIGFVMELPRHIHGNIPQLAEWEKSDAPTVVYPMDVDAALDYVHKMIKLGDFKNIDPNAPSDDDIRHIGGLTFIMARTTHGEIGYSLPGAVPNPPEEDLDILVRFAGAFDLAHQRFLDLQKAEKQAQEIREERDRLEKTLHDLQLTQQQLIQSEKLASLGELTAGIAHEIQNPLNFVNNFSELSVDLANELKEEIKKPEKDWGLIEELTDDLTTNQEKINHHGKRASNIVKGMLEHSRTSSGVKEPTDLNALADEYLRLAYHGLRAKDSSFNAKMETDFDPAVGMVDVIPQDIGRVFLNIINNAFYATQQRKSGIGKLGIGELGGEYEPTVSISSRVVPPLGGQGVGQVVFKIKDNGPGIPEDVKEKIFQPFFTTKPTGQGTGLGLSLAYDIVTKGHGGTLEVEAEEGAGTEFAIKIPVKMDEY